ncbi:branched-chain amino acid ABC transporter permease [Azospirillum canadense]|uniref:branched-chain amino acid ABC transporter permease n=1 Tax=Azospirillum canadense TaxID=403962 RepID=UPI002226026C|nr:branched-chain amino acid ABC transporter permease [Azospirillum canadense]MCW2239406.1 branched-chain amino acid transport system permease protein [Azospirillum canadense]
MSELQILVNGLVLGSLYACMAVGFSLVWGVLNVINMLHGSFIVLGAYISFFLYRHAGVHPFISVPIAAAALFALGYALQRGAINRVVARPVLTTLTLTFGLDMLAYNLMILAFSATPVRIILDLGRVEAAGVVVPVDRLAAMLLALLLTAVLYAVMRGSKIGRAIVAVRMDRDAATLMGIRVERIYATTFALGALMAGAAGAMLALIFPISPTMSGQYLGKVFIVCVLGGLGNVPGALAGGFVLGLVEAFAGVYLGPQNAMTMGYLLMLLLLLVRPTGLMGRKGYE